MWEVLSSEDTPFLIFVVYCSLSSRVDGGDVVLVHLCLRHGRLLCVDSFALAHHYIILYSQGLALLLLLLLLLNGTHNLSINFSSDREAHRITSTPRPKDHITPI